MQPQYAGNGAVMQPYGAGMAMGAPPPQVMVVANPYAYIPPPALAAPQMGAEVVVPDRTVNISDWTMRKDSQSKEYVEYQVRIKRTIDYRAASFAVLLRSLLHHSRFCGRDTRRFCTFSVAYCY